MPSQNPYQSNIDWFNKSLNKGAPIGASSIPKNTFSYIPMDFSASSFKGAGLPRSQAQAQNTKLDFKSPFSSSVSGKFMGNSKIGSVGTQVGKIADIGSALLPDANNDPTTNSINQGYNMLSDMAMMVNPVVGGAMKVMSFANKGLAKVTNGATTINDPSNTGDKILSSDFLALTPIGMLNSATKTKIQGSDTGLANSVTRGYDPTKGLDKTEIGGVSSFVNKLFGGSNLAKTRQLAVNRINKENYGKASIIRADNQQQQAAGNAMQDIAAKNYQKLTGGVKTNVLSASKGTKISITRLKKQASKKLAAKMEEGGKVNVIPSGALHRELNHLDGEHTRKGIPVIMEEGGNLTQQAEIEREELILNIDVTKKLEELLEQFNNGNELAAIEAGKLLSVEILENTLDNVDLINKVI